MVHFRYELWFNRVMRKAEAIQILGGSVSEAAAEVGSTYQAVDKWPEEIPVRIADRVVAAFARKCDRENRREAFWSVLRNTTPALATKEANHG